MRVWARDYNLPVSSKNKFLKGQKLVSIFIVHHARGMLPVEAFATAIKFVDQQKVCLIIPF